MNPGITYLIICLDASGSMGHSIGAVTKGVRALIEEQKRNGHDEVHVGFCMFDDYTVLYPPTPIESLLPFGGNHEANPAKCIPYFAKGGTELYRAVIQTISETDKHIAKQRPENKPGRVIFVVQTDGGDNSGMVGARGVASLVAEKEATGIWEFLFVGEGQEFHGGAKQDIYYDSYLQQGVAMGFTRGFTYGTGQNSQMVQAVSALSVALRTGEVPHRRFLLAEILSGALEQGAT